MRASDPPYLEVAVQAARAGGRILMQRLSHLKKKDVHHKGRYDWVTESDRASEQTILRILKRAFPDHSIRAEESSPQSSETKAQWLIDPLDGTVNYIHQFPMFCVSVALLLEGRLEVGVVYDPVREEMFTARRGAGARLNGRRIRVARRPGLEGAFLATGFPFRAKRRLDLYLESFRAVFLKTGMIRRAGSAALDLAYTACGRVDGFWEMYLSPWDVAAGILLIEEAGGVVTDFFGGSTIFETGHIAAGTPGVHAALVRKIRPIFKGRLR